MLQLLSRTFVCTRRMKPSKLPCEIFRPVAETQKSPRKLLSFGCFYTETPASKRHAANSAQDLWNQTWLSGPDSVWLVLYSIIYIKAKQWQNGAIRRALLWTTLRRWKGPDNLPIPFHFMPKRRPEWRRRSLNQPLGLEAPSLAAPWLSSESEAGWAWLPDGPGYSRKMKTAKQEKERSIGNVGSGGPLSRKAKPAQGFHTSRNSLSSTASVNQLSPNYWRLLHQAELYSQHGARCTVPTGTSAALFCPFLTLTTAEAAHQQKPAFQTALPSLLQPFLSVGPGSQFFLSPHQISLSLWNIQMIWFCSLLPHIKSSPCLWKQWISPRHRRLIYTLQGLK